MSRRAALVAVVVGSVLAGVVGWLFGRQIESPGEAAARVAPPPASLISVPVELQELSSAVVTRGTIEFDQTTGIEVTGSDSGTPIITRLTKDEGDALVEGDVLIEVAGRPLFVLEGELPVFRTLSPSLEGPDVLQLEEALSRLGLDPGPVDGLFGARTEGAVEEFYRQTGYRPLSVDSSDEATLEAAQDRLSTAEDALSSAQQAVSAAGLPRSMRLELDRRVSQAQSALDGLRVNRDASLAELAADRDEKVAEVETAREAVSRAIERHEQAVRERVHPDTGRSPTVVEVRALRLERQNAKQALDVVEAASLSASEAYDGAAAEWEEQVSNAVIDVEITAAQRSEAIEQSNAQAASGFVDQAREELDDAEEDLELLEREIGTRFPASELVFLPSLPRLVQQVNVEVGDFPQGPVLDVRGTELVVVSGVSATDRALLELGLVGTLGDPNLGVSVEAEIDFIADNPGGPDLPGDRYRIRLVPTSEVPEEFFNQNLRLRIPISSTGGEVLTVPLAALSAATDGSSRVERLIDADTTELVDVSVGLSSGGFVEVEALDEATLVAGDRVVVGRTQSDAAANDAAVPE